MKIFIICPVRNITGSQREDISGIVKLAEKQGYKVHWPPRDTNQDDPIGFAICSQNRAAIFSADEIWVWWNQNSTGSLFDLGMAFAFQKKIRLLNEVSATDKKSFNNVLRYLNDSCIPPQN